MANAWVEHIRKFARDNGVTYACAFSDPKCIKSYRASKSSMGLGGAYAVNTALNEEIKAFGAKKRAGRSGRTGEFSIIKVRGRRPL